ncbi:lipoprotein [Spiroplasma clarkii]|nr:lipoprotein [Spiroplasma clarkii]
MKKLLVLLGALSLTASASAGVVACSPKEANKNDASASKVLVAKMMSEYSKALF